MPHAPEARAGTAGRVGRRLLLLLALAACGEAGDDEARSAPAQGGASQAAADQGTGGGAACEPSPAVDDAVLNDTTSWATFVRWRESAGVQFRNTHEDDSTVARVGLCLTCDSVTMHIVSEVRTSCNTTSNFDSTRIVGAWEVREGTVTPRDWGRTFNKGDSIFLFARDTLSVARVVYQVGDRVHLAPPGLSDAWRFRYCTDGHVGSGPQGRWRKARFVPGEQRRDTVPDDEDPPGTYGWMSCASGCCQFYIPPGLIDNGPGRRPPCPEPGR